MARVPRVSVIVPCFNAGPYVAETIHSVLDQSYHDFELIAVDDGSTDRTADILASVSDPRMRLYRQANAGPSAARNRGVAESRGQYLAFLDSDDVWLPGKLERHVRALERDPTLGLVYSDVFFVDESGRLEGTLSDKMPLPSGRVFQALLARNFIATSSVLMPRAVFDAVGPFGPYRVSQDYDLWLKCAARYPVERMPEPMVKYRHRSGGISRQVRISVKECLEIYADWSTRLPVEERPLIARAAGDLLYLAGKTALYENRDTRLARTLFVDALRRQARPGPALFYALALLPAGVTVRARALAKLLVTRNGSTPPAAHALAPGRPRVLMVTSSYYPEIAGGGALQCYTLVRTLQDRVDFEVVSVTRPNDLPERDVVDGVPVCRITFRPASVWGRVAAAWRLTWFFIQRRRAFSIVHCHSFTQKVPIAIGLARLFGKRVLMKFTSYGFDDPTTLGRGVLGPVRLAILRRVDRFVGISPAFAESFRQRGLPLDRFVEMPNGVDTARFAPSASPESRSALRRRFGLPEDRPVVTFIGHFSPEKGVAELVRAWLCVRERGRRAHLVLIGSMSPESYEVEPALVEHVREMVTSAGVDPEVEFVGRTTDVPDYLRASDIFVLPSYREGLPNAVLEAMASGVACVVSRLPGVTDRLIADEANGLLVEPGDVGGLADALDRLLRTPALRAQLGARARETVLAGYSIERVAGRYLSLYQALNGA